MTSSYPPPPLHLRRKLSNTENLVIHVNLWCKYHTCIKMQEKCLMKLSLYNCLNIIVLRLWQRSLFIIMKYFHSEIFALFVSFFQSIVHTYLNNVSGIYREVYQPGYIQILHLVCIDWHCSDCSTVENFQISEHCLPYRLVYRVVGTCREYWVDWVGGICCVYWVWLSCR